MRDAEDMRAVWKTILVSVQQHAVDRLCGRMQGEIGAGGLLSNGISGAYEYIREGDVFRGLVWWAGPGCVGDV